MRRRPYRAGNTTAASSPVLALAGAVAVGATLLAGCTALSSGGNGGWSEARRAEEIAKARAMSAPRSAAEPGSDAASASAATGNAQDPSNLLNLSTALELAARHNRGIAASMAGVDVAAGEVAVARSALLPTNSVRGAYNWYSDEQTNSVDLDPIILPPNTEAPVVTVRQRDFATVSAAVRLAVDLSGELRHGLGASQAAYRAEVARAWGTRLREELAVTTAYYGLLEAKRLREVVGQTLALHQQQLADATQRFEQGRVTRNEVLVVDVAVATSRQSLLRLDNAVSVQRRALNRTTGLDISAPTRAVDVFNQPTLPSLEDALATARARNPLITTMVEEVQAADERLTATRRSRFGRIGAGVAYDATTADVLQPKDYASVGVTAEFDLGSFRREAEIARFDAAARRSRLLLDSSVRQIENLVRDSHDGVRERLAAIDVATVAVGQAEENLRIRQLQFDEGRATSEDVLDATELVTHQQASLASSLYQAHARRAELEQLMGQPLANLASPGAPQP